MKQTQSVALAVTLFGAMVLGSAAQAQWVPFAPPGARSDSAGGKGYQRNASFQFYPIAEFRGVGPSGPNTRKVVDGSLVAAEYGNVLRNRRMAYAFGGWSFFRGDVALIEGHAKLFFTDRVGVQVGLIGGTRGQTGLDSDYFLLYNVRGKNPEQTRDLFNFQVGLGAYAYSRNSTRFTGFALTSYEFTRNFTIDASYWFIQAPPGGGSFQRYGAGVGYKF